MADTQGVARLNVIIDQKLHNDFKAATAVQGTDMTTVILEFIKSYVDKHLPGAPKKGRR